MNNKILYSVFQMYAQILSQARSCRNIFVLILFLPAAANAIPLPDRQQNFTQYKAIATPEIGNDAANSRPIAVSAAATESGNFHLQVRTGALDAPMDAYLAISAPSLAGDTLLIFSADGTLQPMTDVLTPWKASITSIDEAPLDGISLNNIPVGNYNFYLLLAPAGSSDPLQGDYYLWSSSLALTAAKESPPAASALALDKTTLLMGDSITLNHSSLQANTPVNVTFDDGADFDVTIVATPTVDGEVIVATPPLITDNAPFLRSGSVNIALDSTVDTAAFFIVEPPELPGTVPGAITSKVLQFNLDKLQTSLDNIASLSAEEQATMATVTSAIQSQMQIVQQQIAQIDNQFVSVEINNETVVLGDDELRMSDRLMLGQILSVSDQYSLTTAKSAQAKFFKSAEAKFLSRNDQERLEELERTLNSIKENANNLAENTLNSIKNVGVPGTKVLANGLTVGLGLVALTTSSAPVAIAAGGTAALIIVIQTTGMTTTALLLEPSIDAVKGRTADLAQAGGNALDEALDGFTSLGLTFLGTAKWVGSGISSFAGLARDALAGQTATAELVCNTQQTNTANTEFCTLFQPTGIAGNWSTSFGTATFPDVSSGNLRASYSNRPNDNGRIIGTLNDNVLAGIWVEDDTAKRCETTRDGSFNWGAVNFVFNADFSTFSGTWGVCEASPSSGWAGTKN